MDLKAQFEELQEKLQDLIEQARQYFSDLDEKERYGWIAEGTGVALFLTGIVLLIF